VDKWYTFREEEKKDVRGILGGYFVPVPKDYKLSKRGHLQIITSVQPTIFFLIQLLLESGKRPAARGAATVRGGHRGLRPPGRRNKMWPSRVKRAKNTMPETFS
jgi:hypothetical protein